MTEKLLQLELRLKGQAERLFEVLLKESKSSFQAAVDGLRKQLARVRREALVSAELMKQKQKAMEMVDQYAQDFETLFDHSYGWQEGMDQESKDLKRDLFVLGLRMKWQKVLPSAESFSDCLHQARAAEQERQLNELHQPKGSKSSRRLKVSADLNLLPRLGRRSTPLLREGLRRARSVGVDTTNSGIVDRYNLHPRLHGEELKLVPMCSECSRELGGTEPPAKE